MIVEAPGKADRRARLELRVRARRKLDVRRAEHSVSRFVRLHQPKFREVDHLKDLDAALDRSMHESLLIVCEAPPRHFKTSRIMAHMARLLRYRAGVSVAYCTYAGDIAKRRSRNVRDLALRAGVWVGEVQTTRQKFDPSKSVSFWQTATEGQFVAGGRHGQFIGEGFHFIACDDLIKNVQEADSQLVRDDAWTTFRTLWARLEPGGTMLLTMQRLHADDPIGRLKEWVRTDPDAPTPIIITLRAIEDLVVAEDENGRERIVSGTPLCPWRYDLAALRKLASILGPWFWLQYQQDDSPRGKRVFPELARYDEPRREQAVLMVSCDPGIRKRDEARNVRRAEPDAAGIVVGLAYVAQDETGQNRIAIDVLHAEEAWLEGADLLDHLDGLQNVGYPGALVLLEEVSAFALLEQFGLRLNPKLQITAVVPHGSKFWRAQPAARSGEHGLLRVPMKGEWVAAFCKQMRSFTGADGRDDALVDALTQMHDQAEILFGIKMAGASGAVAGGTSRLGSETAWGQLERPGRMGAW